MAQPQQSYPPRTFSPLQSTPSSHHPSFLAPNKRPRLAQTEQSPYSSPNMANIALPNQVFSSPYYGAQPNGNTAGSPYNPPNPPQQSGTMGPPSRPSVDKPTDMNELTDVLLGSGIDLKEEEAALQQPRLPFSADHTSSYNAFDSNVSSTGANSINRNLNFLSRNFPADRNSFYGAGTFNQPTAPYQSTEERAASDRRKAIRRRAERRQYHLNNPFLYAGLLQRRIARQADRMHVSVPTTGLLSPRNPSSRPTEVAVMGPDKHEVLTVLTGQDLLYQDSPLVQILTLLSLATQERLRTLVEDAATLAKGRRLGTHGAVPAELADLAIGDGAFESVAALPTPGNSAVSPKSNPLKRSRASANDPLTPVSNGDVVAPLPVVFPNLIVQTLRQAALADRSAEEARHAKRARRATSNAVAGENDRSGSTSLGNSTPGTPGLLGERAPDVVETKKTSKKEQKRQAEAKATEAQQHAETNKTMSMALGLGGSLGKKLTWMHKDSPPPPAKSGTAVLARLSTNAQSAAKSSVAGSAASGVHHLPHGRRHGDFREDQETGAGIQLRDLVAVLESDGKEKRALERAYLKLQ